MRKFFAITRIIIRNAFSFWSMVYRVVSTKLTEEEHDRLLNVCNRDDGCTPSSYIKEAILGFLRAEEDTIADGTHDSCLRS